MTPKEKDIKEFYDTVTFPGLYSADDVVNHDDLLIYERYLKFLEENDINTILDVGCGSGFITNIIAHTFPHIKIVAVDFSDTINHGKKISKQIGLTNITWIQQNFFDFESSAGFDLVLSNGSIHHMPDFDNAVSKVKTLCNKYIMIGLYNKYGKWMQRKIHPKFITPTFELDQMKIPFELSFTHREIQRYFKEYKQLKVTPSIFGAGADFFSLFRGKWGGFSFYIFKKPLDNRQTSQ
jgi:SAM-dependent methyltransferase